ncbi:MAG: zinc transporter ZntB [Pelagerythrobacter marensis]|nr:MAG: zinc transporter ZntB [Pelagerythrobacter marensis]
MQRRAKSDGEGGARALGWSEAQAWQPARPGEVLWTHLDRTMPEVRPWLSGALGIRPPTLNLLVSDSTRPRAFREGDTLVATLRAINFRGPVDAGALITRLIEHIITRMSAAIIDLNDQIDELDRRQVRGTPDAMVSEIAEVRRGALALQRHMGPEHVALESISRDAPDWFEDHDRREIGETIFRLKRYLEDIDISKESAVVLMDELRARALARSDRTNYLLTLVATIFMPLTFLTGLIGMNVEGIPYATDPQAFWWIVLLCLALVFGMVLLFRWWKWL